MWSYLLPVIGLAMCSNFSPTVAEDDFDDEVEERELVKFSSDQKNGTFTSLQYPYSFASSKNATYKFASKGPEHVQIVFHDFDFPKLRPNEKCGKLNAFVSYEREVGNIVYLCAYNELPLPILAERRVFELQFTVNENVVKGENYRGFNASYRFISNYGVDTGHQFSPQDCHFLFKSEKAKSGSFNSPNFPGFYPSGLDCQYKFFGSEKYLILTFTYFNLPGPNDCSADKVELTETTKNYDNYFNKEYCGHKDVFSEKVNATSFAVDLISTDHRFPDSTFNGPPLAVGFQAKYEFTDSNSSLPSPGFCNYLLLAFLCLVTSSCLGLRIL